MVEDEDAQSEPVPVDAAWPGDSSSLEAGLGVDPDKNVALLQAAVDELSIGRIAQGQDPGGTVVVPSGCFELSEPLVLRSHVTLRGVSMLHSVLRAGQGSPAVLVHEPGVVGSTTESLTLDGAADLTGGCSVGLVVEAGSFVAARRLVVTNTAEEGVVIGPDAVDHLYLEELWLGDIGGDGLVVRSHADSQSLFLCSISVERFGRNPARTGSAGLSIAARCHVNQLFVGPVGPGQIGVRFEPGAAYTTISPYHLRVARTGAAFVGLDEQPTVVLGTGAVEPL